MEERKIYTKKYNLIPEVKCRYGYDITESFPLVLSDHKFDKVFIISENVIFDLYGSDLTENLEEFGINYEVVLTDLSESKKKLQTVDNICNYLLDHKVTKDSFIVAFGGGLLCNMAGLCAALIFRGIRYVEIPTSFLGMTDSSLSNKQAVNGDSGKNQLGTFYAPEFVWSDIKYTATEKQAHIKAAVIEGIKNTFIQEKQTLDEMLEIVNVTDTYDKNKLMQLFEIITTSKNNILANDPTEKKYNVVLEYGHTFGHAIEFLTEGRIIHGQAVAIGMCIAAEISCMIGKITEEELKLHYDVLGRLGLGEAENTDPLKGITPEMILAAIENDNKRRAGGTKYVLLETIGKCVSENDEWEMVIDKEIVIEGISKAFEKIKK